MTVDYLLVVYVSIFLLSILIPVIGYIIDAHKYKSSQHYKQTGQSYASVRFNKGKNGEYKTYKKLRQYESNGAKFLFNVYIPTYESGFTEIDVIMISPRGVVVFESKNYEGWIFGGINQRTWVETFPNRFGGSDKYKFYNPVMQNRTHIKYLKKFIAKEIPIKSIIVFSSSCSFKVIDGVESLSNDTKIIKTDGLLSAVQELYLSSKHELSDVEIDEIYEKLFPLTRINEQVKDSHEKFIDKAKNEGKYGNVCPLCGNGLVVRVAKKGDNIGKNFYGCSNYPKCKYTRNIK